jgi:hypothetical protein
VRECRIYSEIHPYDIPTEKVLQALAQRGAALPIRKPLNDVLQRSAEIAAKFSGPKM